jgi:hypothetical protein
MPLYSTAWRLDTNQKAEQDDLALDEPGRIVANAHVMAVITTKCIWS